MFKFVAVHEFEGCINLAFFTVNDKSKIPLQTYEVFSTRADGDLSDIPTNVKAFFEMIGIDYDLGERVCIEPVPEVTEMYTCPF